jgi:excisionase family DNA binding protein
MSSRESVQTASEALALLTADDLAAAWGCRRKQVYNLVEQHGLPCVQLGRYKRFRAESVQRWLDEREAKSHA